MFLILKSLWESAKWWWIKVFLLSFFALAYFKGGELYQYLWEFAKAQLEQTDFGSLVLQYSIDGITGWICEQLRLPEIFQMGVSIFILKFTLRKIPFLKW
jgi:hypothetical protein